MLDLRTASVSLSGLVAFSGLAALAGGCGGGATFACPDGYAPVADGHCIPLSADAGPMTTDAASRMADAAVEAPDAFVAPDACGSTMWFRDADGDGAGDAAMTMLGCTAPSGWVAMAGDCDDAHAEAHPGGTEACDGLDNDCDGGVDVGLTHTFYADADGDGFGDAARAMTACAMPAGYVTNATDCDDTCVACHPGGTEICDGHDDDCNGMTDEAGGPTWFVDCDGDGYTTTTASSVVACSTPGAPTVACGGAATATWTTRAAPLDCYDFEANTYPGSTYYGLGYARRGTTTFDYDCDGRDTPRVTAVDGSTMATALCAPIVMAGSTSCNVTNESWVASPTCGVTNRLHTCSTSCAAMTLSRTVLCN